MPTPRKPVPRAARTSRNAPESEDAEPKTRKKANAKLSRERAIDAAVALADRDGLGALTMRRLAQELGVEAMSLYHHAANKDEILDAMVDRVFAEFDLPGAELPWKDATRERGSRCVPR